MTEKLLNATDDLLLDFVSHYAKNGYWPKSWVYGKKIWHFVMNLNNVLIYDSSYEKMGVQINDDILDSLDRLRTACDELDKTAPFYEYVEKDIEEVGL